MGASQPSSGNPSPPNSVTARSSVGTLGGDERDGGRRRRQMEEILAQHYGALKRFLNAANRNDQNASRSNKARDKLLRLSPTQFHELSTDVYDELIRRQKANPPPQAVRLVPMFLLSSLLDRISTKSVTRLARSSLRFNMVVSVTWRRMYTVSWSAGFLNLRAVVPRICLRMVAVRSLGALQGIVAIHLDPPAALSHRDKGPLAELLPE
ncbi:Spa2 homology (SHD) of GIT [Penicillium chermesinum]|uniref:Spa2 homology (SHD) of GIT n=1 Tax=Penicillium chermesinum TaxID=63820 RepID=A0A9W9P170_9EURO|nr:Spa2 homology (SHD) of GIT [Penicillium chermesinum]KAJ5232153.1 Spa2 homology (SHD) of GIT [Penicillium chermesinum]